MIRWLVNRLTGILIRKLNWSIDWLTLIVWSIFRSAQRHHIRLWVTQTGSCPTMGPSPCPLLPWLLMGWRPLKVTQILRSAREMPKHWGQWSRLGCGAGVRKSLSAPEFASVAFCQQQVLTFLGDTWRLWSWQRMRFVGQVHRAATTADAHQVFLLQQHWLFPF